MRRATSAAGGVMAFSGEIIRPLSSGRTWGSSPIAARRSITFKKVGELSIVKRAAVWGAAVARC
jgi:hypothetical protein